MTPLITEFVISSPSAEDFQWFDMGRLTPATKREEFAVDAELLNIPYKKTAVVGIDSDGSKFACILIGGQDSVTVSGVYDVGTAARMGIDPFSYIWTDEGLRIYGENNKPPPKHRYMPVLALIGRFLKLLDQGMTGYLPTAAKSLINKKRKAKGKGPLLFSWRTIVIEPKKKKAESQGGTHASPRHHERRGHFRNTPSGKRVWIKACKVGDASKGVVFHDYVIKEVA